MGCVGQRSGDSAELAGAVRVGLQGTLDRLAAELDGTWGLSDRVLHTGDRFGVNERAFTPTGWRAVLT